MRLSAVLLAALVAFPAVAAQTKVFTADKLTLTVEGADPVRPNYEVSQTTAGRTYTLAARLRDLDTRVWVNVTSPAGTRSDDASALAVEYPTSWAQRATARDQRTRAETEVVNVSFVLGPLPTAPPAGGTNVVASVEGTRFVVTLLPPKPILLLDLPAEEGVAWLDAGAGTLGVRPLWYPEGARLSGPFLLGGKDLGAPRETTVVNHKLYTLRVGADVPCGRHAFRAAGSGATVATDTGDVWVSGEGPVGTVAVVRAPSLEFPAGFVTDVAPAEVRLRCFPPGARVVVEGASSPDGPWSEVGAFRVADSGGVEDVVAFAEGSLDGVTTAHLRARVAEGPSVLNLSQHGAQVAVPVKDVASGDELNLVVEVGVDRSTYDVGDRANVAGTVRLAGEPASGVDVTVVWPFQDAASPREDKLVVRTLKTDAGGRFTTQFTAAPAGSGASLARASLQGERDVVATARKTGLNTGVDRVSAYFTGVVPLQVSGLEWRPAAPKPGANATLVGRVEPATTLLPQSALEGARVAVHTDLRAAPFTGTVGRQGDFSVPVAVPASAGTGSASAVVVVWPPPPPETGGALVGHGAAAVPLRVGALDAPDTERAQRATLAEVRALGGAPADAALVRGALTSPQAAPPAAGTALSGGERVVLGPSTEAVLELANQGANATLGPWTRATLALSRIAGSDVRTLLLVEPRGTVALDGAERPPAGSLVVATRFHDVEARGADVVVEARADGGVEVGVWSGSVRVASRGEGAAVDLPAGRRLVLEGDAAPDAQAATPLGGDNPFRGEAPAEETPDEDAPPSRDDGGAASGGGSEEERDTPVAAWAVFAAAGAAAATRRRRR